MAIFIFLHFFLGLASVNETLHLASSLARFCQYISVYQNSKHSQWFKHWPFLLTDQGRTDGQTIHKVIIALFERTFQSVESVDVPAGRAILRHYPQTSISASPSDILETGSVFQSLTVAEKKLVLSPPPYKWS